MTTKQMADIEARMTGILSTVTLDWSKPGASPAQPPPATQRRKLPAPAVPGER